VKQNNISKLDPPVIQMLFGWWFKYRLVVPLINHWIQPHVNINLYLIIGLLPWNNSKWCCCRHCKLLATR